MNNKYYEMVPVTLNHDKLIKTDENNYLASDGWAIQTLDEKLYYTSIDSGHGGREFRIEVGRDAFDYAKNVKPNACQMDEFMKLAGYTKIQWL